MKNDYSSDWFTIFLDTYPQTFTDAEVTFITQQLPQASFSTILDICCGSGRHAFPLAKGGYTVTAVDINPEVIAQANKSSDGNPKFAVHDMRELDTLTSTFDAALNMWQSFGYFDEATNEQVMKSVNRRIRMGGRFIIDIYNRDHFAQNLGDKFFERAGKQITERKMITDNRLVVELDYENDKNADVFSWQIFAPEEFEIYAKKCGFKTRAVCTHVNLDIPASEQFPRMQFVLEKQNYID